MIMPKNFSRLIKSQTSGGRSRHSQLIFHSSSIAQSASTGPWRKACSSAVSAACGYCSSFAQSGLPANRSASHQTSPASSASRSVSDIAGNTPRAQEKIGLVMMSRRKAKEVMAMSSCSMDLRDPAVPHLRKTVHSSGKREIQVNFASKNETKLTGTITARFVNSSGKRSRFTSPRLRRAVPGMIHYAAAHARQIRREPDTFWLSRLRKGPGMQYVNSIFGELLKPIDRRQFREIVERHDGNAYDKTFKSWDHLVTMVGAQLGRVTSLRAVEATVKANSHQHYHLGVSKAPRATLSRANARRPVGVFAETFAMLAKKADRHARVEGTEMVRLIDSSPIPLGKMCEWAEWNGRIRGMKMHVVYHPGNDVPRCVEITPATVNDVEIGRQTELEAGATYVFDKGYYHFGWWKKISAANAFFVTRVKVNTRLRMTKSPYVRKRIGDGFRIIADADVILASKGDSKLPIPLRRIKVKRDKGGTITLITNDLERTAVEIAALYKRRWQIELLFRWIKQHLDIRTFLGTNETAIRLQIFAAMIAYLLLRFAARVNCVKMPALRLAELVCQRLFMRTPIAEINKPPPVNPSKRKSRLSPDQLGFCYA